MENKTYKEVKKTLKRHSKGELVTFILYAVEKLELANKTIKELEEKLKGEK